MPYRAIKRIRFDRDYLVGEEIPDEVVDPARVKFLEDSNYLVKLPDKPKKPENVTKEPAKARKSDKKTKKPEKTEKEPTDNDETGEEPKETDDLSDEP